MANEDALSTNSSGGVRQHFLQSLDNASQLIHSIVQDLTQHRVGYET